jgi:uncharacterized damage-inducible protein DinB
MTSSREEVELESIREWYRYNSYVRKKYLKVIFEKVPKGELYKDRGASFPSIVDIFSHILDAYRYWFVYVYNSNLGKHHPSWRRKKYTQRTLGEYESKIDRLVLKVVEELKPGCLDRRLRSRDRTETLREMLLHMAEEELQHRGELNAMLWQMDIEPPITDWIDWKREAAKKAAREDSASDASRKKREPFRGEPN